jgi:hypothetical protein
MRRSRADGLPAPHKPFDVEDEPVVWVNLAQEDIASPIHAIELFQDNTVVFAATPHARPSASARAQ